MSTPIAPLAQRGRHSSRLSQHPVVGDSAAVAQAVWVGTAGWSRQLRLIPDGAVDICWDGRTTTATVLGTTALRVPIAPGAPTVGVRLTPAAAGVVLDPVVLRRRGTTALDEVWAPEDVSRLQASLRRSASPERAGELLVDAIADRAHRRGGVDRFVALACILLDQGADVSVAAERSAMSVRELRRRFTENVGLGPKAFQRMRRLQRFVIHGQAQPPGRLADLAAGAGFADHPHLTRECRAITGSTPSAILGGGVRR